MLPFKNKVISTLSTSQEILLGMIHNQLELMVACSNSIKPKEATSEQESSIISTRMSRRWLLSHCNGISTQVWNTSVNPWWALKTHWMESTSLLNFISFTISQIRNWWRSLKPVLLLFSSSYHLILKTRGLMTACKDYSMARLLIPKLNSSTILIWCIDTYTGDLWPRHHTVNIFCGTCQQGSSR